MIQKSSGVLRNGMVIAIAAVAIPFSLCLAGQGAVRDLSVPADHIALDARASVCVPIPDYGGFEVTFEVDGARLDARLVETANIREQRIGLFEILSTIDPSSKIDVRITAPEASDGFCVDTGPLARLCSRALVGYGVAPAMAIANGTSSDLPKKGLTLLFERLYKPTITAGAVLVDPSPYVMVISNSMMTKPS